VKQLTRLERRSARLRRIRLRLSKDGRDVQREDVANTPEKHHHIGVSQNLYDDIGTFLRRNAGDPAIQVWTLLVTSHHGI
jgi:hypothetical protein